MKKFSLLRNVNRFDHDLKTNSSLLLDNGYSVESRNVEPGDSYILVRIDFENKDQFELIINCRDWVSNLVSELVDIYWQSVDIQLILSLLRERKPILELIDSHSKICNCTILEVAKYEDISEYSVAIPCVFGLAHVVKITRSKRVNTRTKSFGGLPTKAVFLVGESRVSRKALKKLQTGDVLIIAEQRFQIQCNDISIFNYELVKEGVAVMNKIQNSEHAGEEAVTALSPQKGSPSDLVWDILPIQLSVVLMEKCLTFSELNEVDAGSIIELSSGSIQNVEVRANGVTVARGELVQFDDEKLAVEIRTVLAKV